MLELCDEVDADIDKRAKESAEAGESKLFAHVVQLPTAVVRELLCRGHLDHCTQCNGLKTIKDEEGNTFACPECTIVTKDGKTPAIESLNKIARALEWPQLWYENEQGEKFIPDLSVSGYPDVPKEYIYQWASFACQLEEHCNRVRDDGSGSEHVMTGHCTYWQEVVEQMVRAGYPLDQSILIQANACERCMNVLAWEFGVGGYPLYSIKWHQAGTQCQICKSLGLESRVLTEEELPEQPEPKFDDIECDGCESDCGCNTPTDKAPPVN